MKLSIKFGEWLLNTDFEYYDDTSSGSIYKSKKYSEKKTMKEIFDIFFEETKCDPSIAMKNKEIIIQTLKEFEQIDYKRGGVSIAPEMYNAIADKICSKLVEKKYLFSIDRYKNPNLFKIVANVPYFIISFDADNHSLGKVYYDNTGIL